MALSIIGPALWHLHCAAGEPQVFVDADTDVLSVLFTWTEHGLNVRIDAEGGDGEHVFTAYIDPDNPHQASVATWKRGAWEYAFDGDDWHPTGAC